MNQLNFSFADSKPVAANAPVLSITDERHPREMVQEFRTVFEMSDDIRLADRLLTEEFNELVAAMRDANTFISAETYAEVLKEAADLQYVLINFEIVTANTNVTLDANALKGIRNALQAVVGAFGNDLLYAAFRRVHYSNMSKLVDGKAVRREDGKVQKGPNYAPPTLLDLARSVL